ncbi:MAG: hypothetical protein OQK82_03520 [Candidatus Pacearchaeota archaeon]|nr:hypothetical protein [Candidatus Pacearchaeota archaeon]
MKFDNLNKILVILCFICFPCLYAQEEPLVGKDTLDKGKIMVDPLSEGPKGYRGIEIGMTSEEVKEILLIDPFFDYKGDPDVSFLPSTHQTLIECDGNMYIKRASLQFYNDKLFIMIIELNQTKIDYYTMYTTLTAKYGDSTTLDPTEAIWIFSNIQLSLEKPLTIKYIDKVLFDELKQEGMAQKDIDILAKEEFLKDF